MDAWSIQIEGSGDEVQRNVAVAAINDPDVSISQLLMILAKAGCKKVTITRSPNYDVSEELIGEIEDAMLGEIPPGHEYIDEDEQ